MIYAVAGIIPMGSFGALIVLNNYFNTPRLNSEKSAISWRFLWRRLFCWDSGMEQALAPDYYSDSLIRPRVSNWINWTFGLHTTHFD